MAEFNGIKECSLSATTPILTKDSLHTTRKYREKTASVQQTAQIKATSAICATSLLIYEPIMITVYFLWKAITCNNISSTY